VQGPLVERLGVLHDEVVEKALGEQEKEVQG
jgi:hypothetical protein